MPIPNIYPKPISFYTSPHFSGDRAQPIPSEWDIDKITLFDADPAFQGRILSQLQQVHFRRFGVLKGEYLITAGSPNGLVAIDRNGTPIKINCDADADYSHASNFGQQEEYVTTDLFIEERDAAIANWDKLELVESLPIPGESYSFNNYYHYCMLFLPKVRRFVDDPSTVIGVLPRHVALGFQRNLIAATFGQRRIKVLPLSVRVQDPVLLSEPFSKDALDWLRYAIGKTARKGGRRIYVARRSTLVNRTAGRILETEAFQQFLARHGFETIDFGTGDVSIPDQIALLDGAQVVLSAHGANLTNIGFLEPGVSVIELLPYFWTYFSHMQIALAAQLNYFGVVCHDMNADNHMLPNIATLTTALDAALAAAG